MEDKKKISIYNAIQNLYNMDNVTWQEVLAVMYNTVADIDGKFDILEGKFGILLPKEVREEIKRLTQNGELADIINGEVFEGLNKKVNDIEDKTSIGFNEIDIKKADIKRELLDTFVANQDLFTLQPNTNYTSLQGGCISDDGKRLYCILTNAPSVDEKCVIQEYEIVDIADFSKWIYKKTSPELAMSHGNDMTFCNGKLYVVNTNNNPNKVHIVNASNLLIENEVSLLYGATAITYNKKLNQFITRRKNEWRKFDYYDINLQYVKTIEKFATLDTVQGIDSDNEYIYAPMSDTQFGSSLIVMDLRGNFVKRIGSNMMGEVEFLANYDYHTIMGFNGTNKNYLALVSIDSNRRLTSSRYLLNQTRNNVLYDGTAIFNGTMPLKFSKRYFSHLSFTLTVDNIEVETKIIDLTDNVPTHIINTFRMTGTGQLIFYRCLLNVANNGELRVEPYAYRIIQPDGTTTIKLFSNEPDFFTVTNSLGIKKVQGQILCGQSINEI